MDVKYFLETLDLSKKEAQIYLTLLPHDELSIQDLAKNAKINRTTIYPIVSELIDKGLVGQRRLGKKVNYFAESPERLGVYVSNKKAKLIAQEEQLKDIIPQLKSRGVAQGSKPIVKIYEGREGVLQSIKDFYDSQEKGGVVRLMYPKDKLENFFSISEIKKARLERLSRDVESRSLYTASTEGFKSDKTGERIWLDIKEYPNINCDFSIYGDKIRMHTLGKSLSSIFIQNQDIADTLRTLFDIAFESLKKKSPKDKK